MVQKQFKFGFMELAGHSRRQNKFAYTFSMFSMEQVYWTKSKNKEESEWGRGREREWEKQKQSAVKLWPQRLSENVLLFTLVILVAYVYSYFSVAKVHIFSTASGTIRWGPYLVTVQCTRDSSPMYDKQT